MEADLSNTTDEAKPTRRLLFLGDSLDQLQGFPVSVKRSFGYSLSALQLGQTPVGDISKLKGYEHVFEIRKDVGEAYRVIYCTMSKDMMFVLHAFQKKSPHDSKVPQKHASTIDSRYKQARQQIQNRSEEP